MWRRACCTGPLLAACLLASGCLGGAAGSAAPPRATSPAAPDNAPLVSTSGTGFVDRTGHGVILRGVDVHTFDAGVYSRAAGLGANFVRVTVPWSEYEPLPPSHGRHSWNAHSLDQLDQLVSFYADSGIEVLLDFHQYGWSPYFAASA